MIYATDNGQEYDEHDHYFYELPDDLPIEEGVWLLENQPRGRYGGEEVMFVAKTAATLHNFKPRHGFAEAASYILDTALDDPWMLRCPKALLLEAIDDGVRNLAGCRAFSADKTEAWAKQYVERLDVLIARHAELRALIEARP